MNVARLNGSARAARINAERNLAEMEAIYSRLIVQAAREAATAFTASTEVTAIAASGWLVPPDGILLNVAALAEKATSQLAKLHRRIVKQSASPMLARAGISWDVTHPLVQTLLDQAGARTGERLGNTVRPVLQKIVEGAFNDGLPVRDTAALIRSAIGEAAPGQAQMLARTDLNSLNNGGSIMAAGMVGATYKQWLTAEDDRVRDTHAEADGQTVPIDQPFDVGSEALDYPGDPGGSDEEVCNCFVAETEVAFPALRGSMRRWYEGDVVRVRLASGDVLSGTPNHPVLRSDGRWTPLALLNEGDHLISALLPWDEAGAPHPHRRPTKIGEVDRLARTGANAQRVALSPPDLHGNGAYGEVEVVPVEGSLSFHGQAATDQEVAQFGLSLADLAVRGTGAWTAADGRAPLTAASLVRGGSKSAALAVCHAAQAEQVRLRPGSNRQAEFGEPPHDQRTADAERRCDGEHAVSLLVSTAEIVEVEVVAFHGYVFNLDTGHGWYTANGIVSANCRCTVIYVDASEAIAASGVSFPAMDRVPARGFATVMPLPELRPRMPGRDFAAAPTMTAAAAAIGWVSDIAFEGAATDDGRYMLPGSLTWREPPLTLMAMTETTDEGHNGAFVAGRMDTFERADTYIDGGALNSGMTAIRAAGVFDIGGVNGAEVARLVGDETVRGVSVDLAVDDWCFRDPETGELLEPEGLSPMDQERAMFGELQYAVRAGTILAATVCPTPAFAEARIALTASGDGRRVIRAWGTLAMNNGGDGISLHHRGGGVYLDGLTASAAGLAPALPPRDWFLTPEAKDPTPLTVTKDGRVFGHMALWDSCHTGYPGQCVPPPRSPSGYAYFNLGEVECADGSRVACGAITLEALHADRGLGADATLAHYENTAVVGAFVRPVDGTHGIWVSGALRPDLSERHARDLMGAKPSGDWRQTRPGGPLEMLGVHAVNEPGFPVPRLVASALLPSGARASLAFGEPERALDELLAAAGV